jgi:hypothetical protein
MRVLNNTEIQSFIDSGKYPGLSLTSVSSNPYGNAMVQFLVKFNRGRNRGAQSPTTAKVFTIPVVMGEHFIASGIMPYDAKYYCINNLAGRVADDEFNTNGLNYQVLSTREPSFPHIDGYGVNCLVVNTSTPVQNLEIIKCRSNKQ